MKYLIEIDDRSNEGKAFLTLLKNFTSRSSAISFLNSFEEIEDTALLKKMREGLKTGLSNKNEVIRTLEKVLKA